MITRLLVGKHMKLISYKKILLKVNFVVACRTGMHSYYSVLLLKLCSMFHCLILFLLNIYEQLFATCCCLLEEFH